MTRIVLDPAGQPWWPGPTAHLSGAAWRARVRKRVLRRVASPLSTVPTAIASSPVDDILDVVSARTTGDTATLLRWLDFADQPVILRAMVASPPEAAATLEAAPGWVVREAPRSVPGAVGVERALFMPVDQDHTGDAPPLVEVRYIVTPESSVIAATLATAVAPDELDEMLPELDAIAAAVRIRGDDQALDAGERRAATPRAVETFSRVGPWILLVGVVTLTVQLGLAFTGPGEASTGDTVDQSANAWRIGTGWAFALVSLLLPWALWRDRRLVASRGDRDLGNYVGAGLLIVFASIILGSPFALAVGAGTAMGALVLRSRAPRARLTPSGRLVVALLASLLGWVVLLALHSMITWTHRWQESFGAPDRVLGRPYDALWWSQPAEVVAQVLAWALAVAPALVALLHRRELPRSTPFALFAAFVCLTGLLQTVWVSVPVAVIVCVVLLTGRPNHASTEDQRRSSHDV